MREKALDIIKKEMQLVPNETNEEEEDSDDLTRDKFKAKNVSDPLIKLYSKVCECPGNLFDYWMSKKKDKNTYTLADVALNYLTRLSTSTSTERLFSRSRRIQTFERVRLLPEI